MLDMNNTVFSLTEAQGKDHIFGYSQKGGLARSEILREASLLINLLNSTGHVMHQQFNIQQLYVVPTLYLCVLYLSENKQRLVPLTA